MLKTASKLVNTDQLITPISLAGDVTLSTGNLVIGTEGKGIDFSADPSAAGMTSELLDDYEEGTWTPVVNSTAGTITTVGAVVGRYTKVGRQVTIFCSVQITNNGTGSGSIRIQGVPFAHSGDLVIFTGNGVNSSNAKGLSAILSGNQFVRNADATYPVANGETIFTTITYNV